MGIDMDQIKAHILSDSARQAIKVGATAIVVDGIRLRVVDNVIVSVLDSRAKHFKAVPRPKAAREPSVEEGLAEEEQARKLFKEPRKKHYASAARVEFNGLCIGTSAKK